MSNTHEEVLDKALDWLDAGHGVAIATVIDTWGSSPRSRGSHLVVRDDGLFIGSVSGGCVEGKVVEAALISMKDRAPRLLELGVSNEEAWEVGLACGGTVRIHVAPVSHGDDPGPIPRRVLESARTARRGKRAIILVTPLPAGSASAWKGDEETLPAPIRAASERALSADEPSTVETDAGPVFVQAIQPPLKLVIIGAVHIAEPLSRIAELIGFEVVIVDPREAFTHAARWPETRVVTAWPDEAFATMAIDHRTAIVALTHDPKIDDGALEIALKSPAFYVGALGSKKTQAARLVRLEELGLDRAMLAKLHGPIGLAIGARSPAEIAVAIAAQMTEARRRPSSKAASQ